MKQSVACHQDFGYDRREQEQNLDFPTCIRVYWNTVYTEEENILQLLFCLIYSYVYCIIRCNTVLIRTIC